MWPLQAAATSTDGRREPGPGAGAPSEAGLLAAAFLQVPSCVRPRRTHLGPAALSAMVWLSRSLSPVQAVRDAELLSSAERGRRWVSATSPPSCIARQPDPPRPPAPSETKEISHVSVQAPGSGGACPACGWIPFLPPPPCPCLPGVRPVRSLEGFPWSDPRIPLALSLSEPWLQHQRGGG